MPDPVTSALMKEAGQTRRAGDSVQATAREAVGQLADPNIGAEDSPAQVAERQAQIARQAAIAGAPAPVVAPPPAPAPVAAPQQAANDPVTMALMREAKGGAATDLSIPGNEGAQAGDRNMGAGEPPLLDRVKSAAKLALSPEGKLGAVEAAGTLASGALAGVVGSAAGLVRGLRSGYGTAEGGEEAKARAAEVAHSLTYQPRTEAGKTILEGVGQFAEQSGANRLAGLGPAEGMALAGASAVPRAVQTVAKAAPAEVAAARVPGKLASVGASGAAPGEQAVALAAKASPELQQQIAKAAPKMDARGLKTAERHIDADTLPVPIKLMPGQATQDATLLSQEQNARGAKPQIANRIAEQDKQLKENLDAIRDKAAPDVYATSKPEMGETIIDAYKNKLRDANKEVSTNYKALKDANGGDFPLDGKAFVAAADKALHKDLVFEHVPPAVRRTMDSLSKGGTMTFEQFEAMRTNLARIARSQADGNEKHAAAVIRDALENLPLPEGAVHLKELADKARASSREFHAMIKKDPAMNAVYRDKAGADKFIEKYVLGADKKHVETMSANLAHDPSAQQTMTAGAMHRLRERAGIMEGSENFSQAGYNKALESLRPKLGILFDPESKGLVEQLGRVARYVKGQPTGSFVNNSNTAVALAAGAAKFGIKAALDMAVPGAQLGTRAGKVTSFVKEQKDLSQSMKQYGGMRLKDVSP